MDNLPPWTVRESPRAKRVILRMTPHTGLEVVIPRGFPRSRLPQILQEKKPWIVKTWRRLQEQGQVQEWARELPRAISCPAIGQEFTVEYVPGVGPNVCLISLHPTHLKIIGDMQQQEDCCTLLQRWLAQQGRLHLVPWLAQLSAETGLNYQKVEIRGQKTLWGSCSGRGAISLNFRMLFLQPGAVRYLLLHELCHTRHLDHSKKFYSLLEHFEPDWRAWRQELRLAWSQVPWWAK
mgnify:CR=1 FL=1